jgi:hypothetical protein
MQSGMQACANHGQTVCTSNEQNLRKKLAKGFRETNGEFGWVVTGVKQSRHERDD